MGIRDEQKKETCRKINQAIAELVKEKRYESITIREICQKANISVGSYYKHFNSKDDIIIRQSMQSSQHTREEIVPRLNQENGLANLEVYLKMQNEILNGNDVAWLREVFRLYLYHRCDAMPDKKSINYEVLKKLIDEGQQDGSIRNDIARDELAWIVLKMIIANYFCFCMQEGDFSLDEVMVKEILALCRSNN